MNHTAQTVLGMCAELGFAASGIARAAPMERGLEFGAWIEAGKHGSMEYLARGLAARLDPNLVLAGARSVVMVADVYARRGEQDAAKASEGRVARYARGADYHTVIKKRLHTLCDRLRGANPAEEFRAFVDTAPVPEREFAARAGLGWVGKHTLLIHPRLGSYLLLGGVLTTMDLGEPAAMVPDHCGTCTRCIDACPTDAISPYSVDASRCISYLTIERRLPIDPSFHEAIGDWLYGCDICQEVCPHNSARPEPAETVVPRAEYAPRRKGFDLLAVLGWTEEDRACEFQGTAMKRATLPMMKRNAAIVAGNVLARREDAGLRSGLERVAADDGEAAMVRESAAGALGRAGPRA